MGSKLITRLSLITVLSLSGATQATVYIEAISVSSSQAGPQPGSSYALVQNGVLPSDGSNSAGPNGTSSAGPIGTGVTTAFANTSQIAGPVFTNSLTNADLSRGNLEVHAEAGGGVGIGLSTAIGIPRWTDTITFNNANAFPVELDFSWDTDGSVVDTSGPDWGSADISSSVELNIVNDANWKDIHLKGSPAYNLGGCQFSYSGQFGSGFGFQPSGNNMYGSWIVTPVGNFSGLIKSTLIVPSGVVSITIRTYLSLDCRTGAVCDYPDGAKFRFGTLPGGLSWTSESGVFLSAVAPVDSDGDGTPDAQDGCPNDPNKIAPGVCGCGVVDADGDGDAVCDTSDNCPGVANPDQADADGDGEGDACTDTHLPAPTVVSEFPLPVPAAKLSACGTTGATGLAPLITGLMLMRGRVGRRRP